MSSSTPPTSRCSVPFIGPRRGLATLMAVSSRGMYARFASGIGGIGFALPEDIARRQDARTLIGCKAAIEAVRGIEPPALLLLHLSDEPRPAAVQNAARQRLGVHRHRRRYSPAAHPSLQVVKSAEQLFRGLVEVLGIVCHRKSLFLVSYHFLSKRAAWDRAG